MSNLSHLLLLNDAFHALRDLARFDEPGLRVLHLRVPSPLHIRGQFLVAGLPGAASAARDAHGPTE